MELPTRAYALKNAAVFGAIGLLPLLSASFASTSVSLGFAVGLYLLYNRGEVRRRAPVPAIQGETTHQNRWHHLSCRRCWRYPLAARLRVPAFHVFSGARHCHVYVGWLLVQLQPFQGTG